MVSCVKSWRKKWRRVKRSTPILKSAAVICLLFGLDIRDAIYKVVWIGPSSFFHFRAGSTVALQDELLAAAATASNGTLASGWPSFHSRCERITPFCRDASTFSLSALLTNCRLVGDPDGDSLVSVSLVLIADVRVDSMAWASCKLLFVGRRPPICQEDIVAQFNHRYAFPGTEIPPSWMAPADSDAEAELLRFLDMVSLSVPFHKIVCGEAFAFDPKDPTGEYEASIYGCASPNLHRSEFVGIANPVFRNLQMDKLWLTADVVHFMSVRYGIRQNCKNVFDVAKQPSSGRILLTSRTTSNFSSYGQMYLALILIDVTLLVLHFLSSMEVFTWMLLPEAQELRDRIQQSISRTTSHFKALLVSSRSARTLSASSSGSPRTSESAAFGPEGLLEEHLFYSFFSQSLYRSPTVAAGTFTTQLISWLLVLPNSVAWTWSDSWAKKLQAYLSSVRIWVLILLLTNTLWNGVVLVNEEWAYRFVKRTYVSSLEILAIGALVSFTLRDGVFVMCERKWARERQRVYDVSSFPGFLAHGNTFSLEQDYLVATPADVLWTIYAPLLRILAWGILVLMLYATLKLAVYAKRDALVAAAQTKLPRSRFSKLAAIWPVAPSTQHKADDVYTTEHGGRHSHRTTQKYERSQIEQILDCPVRAKSLIRNTLQMETVDASGRVHISPSCYLDFGVMVRDGDVRSRICFASVLAKARRAENDLSVALEDHPSNMRQRSRVTTFSGHSGAQRGSDAGVQLRSLHVVTPE